MIFRLWLLLCLALALPNNSFAKMPQRLPLTDLLILTGENASQRFQVAVARTEAQQNIGLMYRDQMPEREGMLFPFPKPKQAIFWMRHTWIPLDMIFISKDGNIESIIAETKPLSLDQRPSRGPVIAVLEINGGLAKRLGIKAGQRVCHADLVPHKTCPKKP
jgi:uncharacterized protein